MKAAEIQHLLPGIFQRTVGRCEFYHVEGAGDAAMNGIYDRVDDSLYVQQGDATRELSREDLGGNRGGWRLTCDRGRTVVYRSQHNPQSGQEIWTSVDPASNPVPNLVAGSSNPLQSFLNVMERMQAPAEDAVAGLDRVLDPRRTPDAFVPLLARWVDLDRLLIKRLRGKDATVDRVMPTGLGWLRELIANAAYLSKWRGTHKGLLLFLQTATGLSGFDIDEAVPGDGGRPKPFHIRVSCPADAELHRDLICEIIESEKPAYVTYELAFATESVPKESSNAKDI